MTYPFPYFAVSFLMNSLCSSDRVVVSILELDDIITVVAQLVLGVSTRNLRHKRPIALEGFFHFQTVGATIIVTRVKFERNTV